MRTLVIGAGGVGGYFGARLAQAGVDVTIAARGAHGRALRERGLTIKTERGDERITLPKVVEDVATLTERFELVLIAVKSGQLESACDALPNLISVDGVVAPLLNGLTSEDVVASYVGAQRTLAAVAYISGGIVSDGVIYEHGHSKIGLAPYRPGQELELNRVAALFERAGVPVRKSEDYRAMLWSKMVWNAPLNAICALTGKASGVCVERMEPLVRRGMNEVIAVARAEGVELPPQLVDVMLRSTLTEFALTEPSMLQDVRNGRATEVDSLQGEVVLRAEQHGVATPVLSTLAELVRALG